MGAGASGSGSIEHASGAEEATAHLAQLCTAIRQRGCRASTRRSSPVPQNPLSRRLLGLVRGSFVERVQVASAARCRLSSSGCSSAMEAVGQRLEADWSQHFADRLAAPDGLELVVEVAHDLRSPLTSILFLAETLQRGRSGPVNPVQERQLGLIYSAAFGLSSVASDVIELARGGDRLVDLDPIPFSVTDILESVRDIVQPIAEEKNLAVRLSPPEADFRIGHPGRAEPGAAQPHHQRPQVHRRGLRGGDRPADREPAARSSSRCAIPGAGFRPSRWPRCSSRSAAARSPASTPSRAPGLGPVDLPQAGRGDGIHPGRGDRAGRGDPLLLRARPAAGRRIRVRLSRPLPSKPAAPLAFPALAIHPSACVLERIRHPERRPARRSPWHVAERPAGPAR